MSRSDSAAERRRHRSFVGAAAVALIALAAGPTASADTDLDPYEDLFGNVGVSYWTTAADANLASLSPSLADNMDTSVDNFLALAYSSYGEDAPFSYLLSQVDPNAFSTADLPFWSCFIDCPTFPTDSAGEFALSLDYSIFASGLGPTVDPLINSIPELVYFPEQVLVLLALLFG